jgi:aspartate kinase
MEQAIISGIAHDRTEAKLTVRGVPDRPGVAAALFEPLAEGGVNVDMIVQNIGHDGTTDISFTVPKAMANHAGDVAGKVADELGAQTVEMDENVGKISLVGAGMKSHPGVAARVFRALAEAGINIEMISTSTIRISCIVSGDQLDQAVVALHHEFQPPLVAAEVGA